jgi:hypothetical protein
MARIGGACQCPSRNHSLAYGENCKASVARQDFWNATVSAAPLLLGRASSALLRLDAFDPPRPLAVQLATYNISAPAQQGALGLDQLGPPEPVSLLADVLPSGLLFRAGSASLTLAYNPALVANASALLALRFEESTANWEPVPATHDAAAAAFSLPLAASGRYALFQPRRAAAAPPPPRPAPPSAPPPAPAGLYAEAGLAVLSLSAAFAFLVVGVPLLVRALEPAPAGDFKAARGGGGGAAAAGAGGIVVDNFPKLPAEDPA